MNKKSQVFMGILIIAAIVGIGLLVFGVIFPQAFANALSEEEVKERIDKSEQEAKDDESTPDPIEAQPVNDEENIEQHEPKLTPPPATDIECTEPTGVFKELWVRHDNQVSGLSSDAQVLGVFKYTGNCKANIYLEAGIPNAPRDFQLKFAPDIRRQVDVVGEDSICDGNKHFNGARVTMQPGQEVTFLLRPENYGVEAIYPLNIGAYTGCLNAGGKPIQELRSEVAFSNSFSQFQIDNSWFGG